MKNEDKVNSLENYGSWTTGNLIVAEQLQKANVAHWSRLRGKAAKQGLVRSERDLAAIQAELAAR